MNIDFEKARSLMVENQLKPNKINEPKILNLFKKIKKEDFLSKSLKEDSYNDLDINLIENRGYLKNLHIAQLIKYSNITKQDKILHVGGMTGYVSSLLANMCKELIVIENQDYFIENFKNNIDNLKIKNIKIFYSNLHDGFEKNSPYDIIFIDNPIEEIPDSLRDQLKINTGKIIMIKKISNHLCKAFKIIRNNNNYTNEYLFDVFTKYLLYKNKSKFVF